MLDQHHEPTESLPVRLELVHLLPDSQAVAWVDPPFAMWAVLLALVSLTCTGPRPHEGQA